jgi:hypothetical protein
MESVIYTCAKEDELLWVEVRWRSTPSMGHAVSWEMERSASGSACFLQLIYTVSKYLSLFSKKYQVATNIYSLRF